MNNSADVHRSHRQRNRRGRQKAMADTIKELGAAKITDLTEKFGISLMTAHRDLDELEARGILRKSRNSVTTLPSTLVESSVCYRQSQRLEIKTALAAEAVRYVAPGQSLLLDDSTTVHQIIPMLTDIAPITVITNSMIGIRAIRQLDNISLISLGGEYHAWCASFMGRITDLAIGQILSDVVLMSTAAKSNHTAFFQCSETVSTKRAMLTSARLRILIADHSKFTARALYALAPLNDVDHVIIDALTPTETVISLRQAGINLTVVNPP